MTPAENKLVELLASRSSLADASAQLDKSVGTAVTTFHEQGYLETGRTMIQSFDDHWPQDVQLHVFAEDFKPDAPSERIIVHDLLAECPELLAFKERHKDNPLAHGK